MGSAGTGGMLIAAHVLRALPDPWFEFEKFGDAKGGEDAWFTLCAKRAGFRVWCDLDTHIGHLTTAALWPSPDWALEPKIELVFDDETLKGHGR
jgi:hypothetical protein